MTTTLPERLVVTVTAGDIERGVPHSACGCPIARAIGRLYPTSSVQVGPDLTIVCIESRAVEYAMPPAAREFIHAFDADVDDVSPIEFALWETDRWGRWVSRLGGCAPKTDIVECDIQGAGTWS